MYRIGNKVGFLTSGPSLLTTQKVRCCRPLARTYCEQKPGPPMSQKLANAKESPQPSEPSNGGGGRKIAVGLGVAAAAVGGGALLMLDPLGVVTEKKPLAPAPSARSIKDQNESTSNAVAPDSALNKSEDRESASTPPENCGCPPPSSEMPENATSKTVVYKAPDSSSKSITTIAEESAQFIVSGKRSADEEILLANYKDELARQSSENEDINEAERDILQKTQQIERERSELAAKAKQERTQELEKCLSHELTEAMELLKTVTTLNKCAYEAREQHSVLLGKALEADKESDAQEYWPKVREMRQISLERVAHAEAKTNVIESQLNGVFEKIAESRADPMISSHSALDGYEKLAKEIAAELKKSASLLERDDSVNEVMKHYYDVLKGEHKTLHQELEHLPDFKPGKTGDKFTTEELSELVLFAHRRVFQLQKQLREQEYMQEQRLQEVIEEQKEALDVECKKKLNEELAERKSQHKAELEKEMKVVVERHEQQIRDELARQGLAKTNHARDMLKLQKELLVTEYQQVVQDQLILHKSALMKGLDDALAKLEKLEKLTRVKADVEKVVINAQQLISSTRELVHTVNNKEGCGSGDYNTVKISDAVRQCQDSAPNDAFVKTVLQAIPSLALSKGIYTLNSLEKRFDKVFEECKKDALFPNSNNMISSTLSRMYGKLLAYTIKPRYNNASDFNTNGIEGMDTKDLLVQAQYFMNRHLVAEAIKCMVQLRGLPRKLAQDWITEALLFQEVHQASDVLMHYALSQGFGNLI